MSLAFTLSVPGAVRAADLKLRPELADSTLRSNASPASPVQRGDGWLRTEGSACSCNPDE